MSFLNNLRNAGLSSLKNAGIRGVAEATGLTALGDLLPSSLQNLLLADPQRSYMWSVRFTGGFASLLGNISFYAKTAEIPDSSIDVLTRRMLGRRITYPGKDSSDHQFTMTFWDDEMLTVYNFFYSWFTRIHQPDSGASLAKSELVVDAVMDLMDRFDVMKSGRFIMQNVYPTTVLKTSLSYETAEAMEVTVVFAYDKKNMAG